jgi:hypothetical protein
MNIVTTITSRPEAGAIAKAKKFTRGNICTAWL